MTHLNVPRPARIAFAALLTGCAVAAPGLADPADCPGTARLAEALVILDTAKPVLRAEAAAFAEAQRQRDWRMELALGYDTNTTFESGQAGARAALRVAIPLFDRQGALKKATARAEYTRGVDAQRTAFLADLEALCTLAAEVRALDTYREFNRDRTRYRQARVDEGLDEPDTLWTEFDAAQRAEHDYRAAAGRLQAQRLLLSRRWGGADWERLQALLAAMTR